MPCIELHLGHDASPALFNTANILSISTISGRSGTTITVDDKDDYVVSESYEVVKNLILQAEKA